MSQLRTQEEDKNSDILKFKEFHNKAIGRIILLWILCLEGDIFSMRTTKITKL
jgi:hypothetical protein